MFTLERWWQTRRAGQLYEPLNEDHEESVAETESKSSGGSSSKLQVCVQGESRAKSALLYTLVGLSAITLLLFLPMLWLRQETRSPRHYPMPDLPPEKATFIAHPEYAAPASPESDALWMSLLGPGMGFLEIQNPQRYGLKRGIETGKDTAEFGISMFHSLHCLAMIRTVYWQFLGGSRSHNSNDTALTADVKHTNHCFDYIRQGIMCSGDMTLEGAKAEGSQDINGMGVEHTQCKSWDVARAFMDAHAPAKRVMKSKSGKRA